LLSLGDASNYLIRRAFHQPFHIAGNIFNSVEIVGRCRDHHVEQHQRGLEMAKMRAIDAAVRILEKEGVVCAFGVPGAAINPLYSALKKRGSINHFLARHVEGASHMAEGYTRAKAGNIGVCIGTSGPAGTDMITGLYSAISDSIPILCITGQAPRARLYKEDFQAVDIE
jgi:tartronate-semialdehyde synthase